MKALYGTSAWAMCFFRYVPLSQHKISDEKPSLNIAESGFKFV
jgi:hypothetical protein